MLKVVKRPNEYVAIKVPEVCEDVGKIVSEEAEKAGIRLDITTYYADSKRWLIRVGVNEDKTHHVRRGSIVVCKISQDGSKYHAAVDVMSQEKFDNLFKPADEPAKSIKAEMSTKIEGVELPDHAGFSESFIAELDKALNDYHHKQAHKA